MLFAKMDQVGRPAWVAATLLGFWLFWPIGLGVLGYLAWTGRLREMREGAPGQWFNLRNEAPKPRASRAAAGPSGNEAFDDYRAETLRRLEDEQREFVNYLERLRRARDKAEFDQFMAERRGGPPATDAGK